MKEVLSTTFVTTDGTQFLNKDEAKNHQAYLDHAKVYLVICDNCVEFASLSEYKAKEYINKHNDVNYYSYYYLKTAILE